MKGKRGVAVHWTYQRNRIPGW